MGSYYVALTGWSVAREAARSLDCSAAYPLSWVLGFNLCTTTPGCSDYYLKYSWWINPLANVIQIEFLEPHDYLLQEVKILGQGLFKGYVCFKVCEHNSHRLISKTSVAQEVIVIF